MKGSIWSVVALGTATVMLPLILPSSGVDSTGSDIFGLLTAIAPTIGLMFVVATFGLLLVFFNSGSGF